NPAASSSLPPLRGAAKLLPGAACAGTRIPNPRRLLAGYQVMWLVKASLQNPYAVSVLAFLILVLGLVSLANIPVDILPVFKAPAVQVMTYYQGMPTASVEKTITNRIERWTNQATGCQRVESKSTLGVSVVRLYFRDDIDPNGALTQVNSLALG